MEQLAPDVAEKDAKEFLEQNARDIQEAQKILQEIEIHRRKSVEEGMARADQLICLEKSEIQ